MKSNGNNYCDIGGRWRPSDSYLAAAATIRSSLSTSLEWGALSFSKPLTVWQRSCLPTHIFINTNEEYVQLVKEQLPEVPAERILAEPIHRNTAPSMA